MTTKGTIRKRRLLNECAFREIVRIAFKTWISVRRMVSAPTYKARLIFASRARGLLNWPAATHEWTLPDGRKAILTARHVASLAEATEFHIDISGFKSHSQARKVGENLRGALRLANAVLGIGLNVPMVSQEIPRARLAPHVKEKLAKEHGASIVDCVFGLNVLKEGEEFELAVRGDLSAKPKHSDYVLDAASQLWGLEKELDDSSKLACELLNVASRDTSPRSAFLVSFLALDLLMERQERSDESLKLLAELGRIVDESGITTVDKARLRGFLGQWQRTSLKAELDRHVAAGNNAAIDVNGEPLGDFLQRCVALRHRLAHPSSDGAPLRDDELNQRRSDLREVVLGIIWARNKLPGFSVHRPSDVVEVSEMKLSII